jgi:transposase
MQAKVAGLEAHTERQDYLIAELRHALYGKRSEQLPPDERQLAFEDMETAVAEAEAARAALAQSNADGRPRRPAAKRNLGHLPDHPLPPSRRVNTPARRRAIAACSDERGPRIEQVIEPAQKICPCGCTDMVKPPFHGLQANHYRATGEDRAERLDIVPARFQVIVTIRPRYACRRCDAGVVQADTPNWLIEGGLPTEGTLAPSRAIAAQCPAGQRMSRSPSMPTTCHFIANARSMAGAAWTWTGPPWQTGAVWRPIIWPQSSTGC